MMGGFGFGGSMLLWWLFGFALLVLFIWWLSSTARRGKGESGESPEAILKRRYARGEIDREEYQRRLEDLRR